MEKYVSCKILELLFFSYQDSDPDDSQNLMGSNIDQDPSSDC